MFSLHNNLIEVDCINIASEDESIIVSAEFFIYGWKQILWIKWMQFYGTFS